ncbi:hypothetical protein DFH06DRAFT_1477185 [Mycena polygramma]|nr:hypothetical protein DFH06DRAFT_1477185 [Mycena polygramma]
MSAGSRCYQTYSLTSSATDVGLPANFGIQQLRFCPCRTARLGMDRDKRGRASYACQQCAPCTRCYADQASRCRARAVYTGASAAVVCPASVDSVGTPSTLSAPHNAGATASVRSRFALAPLLDDFPIRSSSVRFSLPVLGALALGLVLDGQGLVGVLRHRQDLSFAGRASGCVSAAAMRKSLPQSTICAAPCALPLYGPVDLNESERCFVFAMQPPGAAHGAFTSCAL